ncbi:MAG: HNH endonuclease [Deltaproteobacteria bacterium]|nr:MAG: HNH endonuclease [Deltaproteobacteria bacterium]
MRLARGAGALRLALGEGLVVLRRTGGVAELGFPNIGAYAFERLGRRWRFAEDAARVAEQLALLPEVRGALARGEIGWSMAELLGRSATPDNEAALLAAAREGTVRALRSLIAETKGREPAPTVELEDERRTLQVSVPRETAWAYEATRRLLYAQIGASSDEAVVEALLAEASVTLSNRHPGVRPSMEACAQASAWDEERARERDAVEAEAEGTFVALREATRLAAPLEDVAPPLEPAALDAHLRAINARLQRRDRRLGQVARTVFDAAGWRHFGYATAAQYARERLGCSLAFVKARMTFARRTEMLPEVTFALDAGTIGFEAACLVSRVADPDTVGAWLGRAGERTVKHLKEEVEVVESIARADGVERASLAPPSEETVQGYLAMERAMLDGTLAKEVLRGERLPAIAPAQLSSAAMSQMSGEDTSQMSGEDMSQMSGARPEVTIGVGRPLDARAGRVTLRLRLTADLVAFWHDVVRMFHEAGEVGEFLDFLVRVFWREWLVQDTSERVAYQDVYERERYRCASPVCSGRDLTPHHIVFRSRGGGEERSNLVGLCVSCHLDLLHTGRLRAEPPADDVRWTLGREGLLVVQGRTVVQRAA